MKKKILWLAISCFITASLVMASCSPPVSEEEKNKNDILDYGEAISIDPNNAQAYYDQGLAYYNLSQFDNAVKDYDEAIDLNPKYADTYYHLGLVLEEQDKKAEAIAAFEKFIEISDNSQLIETAKQHINELSK